MLVNCPNCGTPFDVEKRGSVCPKCNTDINKIKKKKNSEERTNQENTNGKSQLKPCLIIIALIVIVAAYTIYVKVSTEVSAKQQRQVGVLEPQIVQTNEKIYIGDDSVQIYDCEIVSGCEEVLPEGYSLLTVSYSANVNSGIGLKYKTSPYLLLNTGEFMQPLDREIVTDTIKKAGAQNLPAVTEYMDIGNGKLVFLVSSQTSNATMVIYTFKVNGKKIDEQVYSVADAYHIPIEWEVQY